MESTCPGLLAGCCGKLPHKPGQARGQLWSSGPPSFLLPVLGGGWGPAEMGPHWAESTASP